MNLTGGLRLLAAVSAFTGGLLTAFFVPGVDTFCGPKGGLLATVDPGVDTFCGPTCGLLAFVVPGVATFCGPTGGLLAVVVPGVATFCGLTGDRPLLALVFLTAAMLLVIFTLVPILFFLAGGEGERTSSS